MSEVDTKMLEGIAIWLRRNGRGASSKTVNDAIGTIDRLTRELEEAKQQCEGESIVSGSYRDERDELAERLASLQSQLSLEQEARREWEARAEAWDKKDAGVLDGCICCANGNDLPDGEYCRACGRENNVTGLARAVMLARGISIPPTAPVEFSNAPVAHPAPPSEHEGVPPELLARLDEVVEYPENLGFRTEKEFAQDVEDLLIAYRRRAAPPATPEKVGVSDETGWLIEEYEHIGAHRWLRLIEDQYSSGSKVRLCWNYDANIALRFAREEDARLFASMNRDFVGVCKITEHCFFSCARHPAHYRQRRGE